jgi:hypothetical protein
MLAHLAGVAYSNGLNAALLTGCVTVFVGAVSAVVLMRGRTAQAPAGGQAAVSSPGGGA